MNTISSEGVPGRLLQWAVNPDQLPADSREEKLAGRYFEDLAEAEISDNDLRTRRAVVGNLLGRIRFARGNMDGALDAFKLAILDDVAVVDVERHIVMIRKLKQNGSYELALEYALRLNAGYRDAGDREGEMHVSGELGQLHKGLGDVDKALELIGRAHELARMLNVKREEQRFGLVMSLLYKRKKDFRSAIEWGRKSLRNPVEDPAVFRSHAILSECFASVGDFERAEQHIHAGLDITIRNANPREQAVLLATMANLKLLQEDVPSALEFLESAEEIFAGQEETEHTLQIQRKVYELAKGGAHGDVLLGVMARHLKTAEKTHGSTGSVIMYYLVRELLEFVSDMEPEKAGREMSRLFTDLNEYAEHEHGESEDDVSTMFLFFMNVVVMLQLSYAGESEEALLKAQELDEAAGGELKLESFLNTQAASIRLPRTDGVRA